MTLPAFADRSRPGANGAGAAAELNAWLKIGTDDSITVLVDRSEMGQGVYTALPMLLAEELEIDLHRIEVLAAPVGDAYVNPLNGGQITGTSNSIQDAWEKLRTAGAQARLMLIAAAARKWRVDPGQCRAADGCVTNTRGNSLRYGDLAAAAAKLPVPKDVKLKPPAAYRLIGKPQARLDTPAKVDGTAEFGLDVRLPGMAYAAIALCPTLGGKAAAVDSAAAEALPGVRRVLSTLSGVVVVADHFWQALKARNALKISWEPGANAHLDNTAVWASLNRAAVTVPRLTAKMTRGDTASALKRAEKTLSAVYELPLLAHATMEPMNCTADVRADRCDLYVGTQVQQGAQVAAAEAAGLKPEQVNVHTTLLGGGFGRRLEVDFVPASVEASKALGVPVKLVWTREDDMTHDFFRPPAREEVSAGFDAHGKLLAFGLHITSPSITARASPSTVATDPFDSVIEYAQNFPYAVPNYLLSFSRQEIGIDVGYMRSVSHAPNCFAIECFIDELAAAVSKDPLDFRLELLTDKPRHTAVLKEAARRANWGRAPRDAFWVSRSWRAIPRTSRKWPKSPSPEARSRFTGSPASSTAARWSIRASSSRRSRAASSTDSRPRSGATSRCARAGCARPTSIPTGYYARTRCPSSTCISSRARRPREGSARRRCRWCRPPSATRCSPRRESGCGGCRLRRTPCEPLVVHDNPGARHNATCRADHRRQPAKSRRPTSWNWRPKGDVRARDAFGILFSGAPAYTDPRARLECQ